MIKRESIYINNIFVYMGNPWITELSVLFDENTVSKKDNWKKSDNSYEKLI
ncbi:hypothetical protein HM22_02977 [Listeria monocytogenes]|nr:hypothetical protein HM22_02977 [Listeria monocytogenes]